MPTTFGGAGGIPFFANRPVRKTSNASCNDEPIKVSDNAADKPVPAQAMGRAEWKAPTGGLAALLFANRSAKSTAAPNNGDPINTTANVSAAAMPTATATPSNPTRGLAAPHSHNPSTKMTAAPNEGTPRHTPDHDVAAVTPLPSAAVAHWWTRGSSFC